MAYSGRPVGFIFEEIVDTPARGLSHPSKKGTRPISNRGDVADRIPYAK
jgi:hypothetical protein